jgi:hypothetical protein
MLLSMLSSDVHEDAVLQRVEGGQGVGSVGLSEARTAVNHQTLASVRMPNSP